MLVHRAPFFTTKEQDEKNKREVQLKSEDRVFLIKKTPMFFRSTNIPPHLITNFALVKDTPQAFEIAKTISCFWSLLVDIYTRAECNRIIIAPSSEKKMLQTIANIRLGAIKNHPAVYGFVRGRSAYDCAKAHTDFHGGKIPLLVKMDISSFFNSFSEPMIRSGLTHHWFTKEEQDDIVTNSMMAVDMQSPLISNILIELMKPSCFLTEEEEKNQSKQGFPFIRSIAKCYMYAATLPSKEVSDTDIKDFLFSRTRSNMGTVSNDIAAGVIKEILKSVLKCGPNTGIGEKMLFQGGPSSPFLSNICFKGLDYRIDAYAKTCGGFYTRYADDMCFSFSKRKTTKDINLFTWGISNIVKEGGFIVNRDKTTITGLGRSQKIVGYCVNSGIPTVPQEYRRKIYHDILSNIANRPNPIKLRKVIMEIEGKIAYIQSANPEVANMLRQELKKLSNQQSKRTIEI